MKFTRRAGLGALLASAVTATMLFVAAPAVSSASLAPQVDGNITVVPTDNAYVQSGVISFTATLASACPTAINPAQIVFEIGTTVVTPASVTGATTTGFVFTMGSNTAPANNTTVFGSIVVTCSDSTPRVGEFSYGEALVTKTVSGSVADGTSFVIHAVCTRTLNPTSVQYATAAVATSTFDLTLQAGGSSSVFGADLYTTCVFSEPDTKGATVSFSSTSVEMSQPQLYTVAVTNTFPTTTTSTTTTVAPAVDPPRFTG